MSRRREYQFNGNSWTGIIVFVLAFLALFFIANSIFRILSFIAPLLLIAAAIIDYKVIVNFVKWLIGLVKDNIWMGLGAILLTIVGYPVVFAFLLGKALLNRRIKKVNEELKNQRDGEFIEYEEVESRPNILELPELKKQKEPQKQKEPRKKEGDYDQFFE
jgi:ABC-type multidrug transport system fused ATPase/permease subunit